MAILAPALIVVVALSAAAMVMATLLMGLGIRAVLEAFPRFASWEVWLWAVGAIILMALYLSLLRRWFESALFERMRRWAWQYRDEPFHDPRRPEGQRWVFAPYDDFPRSFATEQEARDCAVGWLHVRHNPPPRRAHARRQGEVPVYHDPDRVGGHQWVVAEPGMTPLAFATRREADAHAAACVATRQHERTARQPSRRPWWWWWMMWWRW